MSSNNSTYSADTFVASVLMVFALPICLVLGSLVYLKLGRPIFYKGGRLGKDKKLFDIYKFRTLPNNSQQSVIGAELLNPKHSLTTPFTEFLRDTRLDELPQLWNVAKGDMNFIGPRPERPEIYKAVCQKIHNYDKRFMVKPGLLGYSQLFTPHSTPKRMRALVDNAYIHHKSSLAYIVKIVLYTIAVVCQRISLRLIDTLNDFFQRKVLQRYSEKRKNFRKGLENTTVEIVCPQDSNIKKVIAKGYLVNMNMEAFLVYSNDKLSNGDELIYQFTIPNIKRRQSHVAYKTAKCSGCIIRTLTPQNKNYQYGYVVFYEPTSPFNYYLIEQYILHASLAY